MTAPKYPVFLAAVEIVEGVNDTIDYDAGAGSTTATIAPGTYYLRGDGAVDDLCTAIVDALTADGAGSPACTVTHDVDAAQPSSTCTVGLSGLVELLDTGTFDLALLGLVSLAAFAGVVTSTRSSALAWVSTQPYRTKEPRSRRPMTTQHETPEAGGVYTFVAADVRRDRTLSLMHIAGARVLRERGPTDPTASFEAWWELASDGRDVEVHLPRLDAGTALEALTSDALTLLCTAVLTGDSLAEMPLVLTKLSLSRYGGDVHLVELSRPDPLPAPTVSYGDLNADNSVERTLTPTLTGYIDSLALTTGALEAGWTLNTTTGVITIPIDSPAAEVTGLQVTATGPGGVGVSAEFSITITEAGVGYDPAPATVTLGYRGCDIDGTGTDNAVYDDLDPVPAWEDAEGTLGVAATQATSSAQPTFSLLGGPNGTRDAVVFDGGDSLASVSFTELAQPNVISIVAISNALGANNTVWSSDVSTGGVIGHSSDGGQKWRLYAGTTIHASVAPLEQWETLIAVFNGATSTLSLSGVEIIAGNAGSGGPTASVIGRQSTATLWWVGRVADILVHDVAPTTDTHTYFESHHASTFPVSP